MARHTSGDASERLKSAPLLLFERVAVEGRSYGNLKFQGFGVIEKAELVTQYNPGIGYFTNYVFTFAVLSLSDEDEELNWKWILDRRSPELKASETLENAPVAWSMWLRGGIQSLKACVEE